MLVKRMKLLWQCSVRVEAPPPNISCNDAMICFGRSAWESCSTVCAWDSAPQGKTAAKCLALLSLQNGTRLVLYMYPILTSLLFRGVPVLWVVAMPLPPQANFNIVYRGLSGAPN